MDRISNRYQISGRHGKIAAILDSPVSTPLGFGIFAHCFSCTKDLKSIVKISRELAVRGYAVLRFDFAGLGNSEGVFSDTSFLDNLNDIRDVVTFMNSELEAPRFLVGHSLGGSAMLATAMEFQSVESVAVIAAPSNTGHLADTIYRLNPNVEEIGQGMVNTGTYQYLLKKEMVSVLRKFDLKKHLVENHKRLMVFHSPADLTLGMDHANFIVENSAGPACLIDLESANHLLTDDAHDCGYVASVLSAWLDRYLLPVSNPEGEI